MGWSLFLVWGIGVGKEGFGGGVFFVILREFCVLCSLGRGLTGVVFGVGVLVGSRVLVGGVDGVVWVLGVNGE